MAGFGFRQVAALRIAILTLHGKGSLGARSLTRRAAGFQSLKGAAAGSHLTSLFWSPTCTPEGLFLDAFGEPSPRASLLAVGSNRWMNRPPRRSGRSHFGLARAGWLQGGCKLWAPVCVSRLFRSRCVPALGTKHLPPSNEKGRCFKSRKVPVIPANNCRPPSAP